MPSLDIKANLNAASALARQPLVLSFLLLFLPAFAVLVHDLFEKSGDLACQVAMRLSVAQLLTQGRELYTDFFEWSQPIVFEFGKFVYLLQGLLGPVVALRAETVAEVLLSLFLLLSACSCLYLLVKAQMQLKASEALGELPGFELSGASYMAALALFCFYMRLQTGELQWYLSVMLAPWLLLRYLRYQFVGLVFARPIALILGVAAGIVAMSELPYLLIFILLEVYFVSQTKSLKKGLMRPECLSFLLAIAAVVGHFFCQPLEVRHGYIHWLLPVKLMSWQCFDEAINGPGASPDQSILYYVGSLALLSAVVFYKQCKLMTPLALIVMSGFAINLLEKQGFTRDVVLVSYGSIVIIVVSATLVARQVGDFLLTRTVVNQDFVKNTLTRLGFVALTVVVLVAVPVLLRRSDRAYGEGINPHPREILKGTEDINIAVGKNSHWKDPVTVMCDFPDPSYPLLFNLERPNDSYFITGRPVRLLSYLKKIDGLAGNFRELYEHSLNVIRDRIDRRSAALFYVHGSYQIDYLADAGLMQTLEQNYDRVDDASYYSDNVEPREYLGYYFAFDQFVRRGDEQK
ncbi:MAG: hypothetical protein IPP97_24275 [Candidatus Obscuribacter sp.]|nr:hypothetical protein [Candidatus Obscuribacter sp.]